MEKVNLDHLAYDIAEFAHSGREPTSADKLIRGPRPYYYCWTKDGGVDILIFKDPADPQTAKLFRYEKARLFEGVDLTKDAPAMVGEGIVKFLRDYSKEK